MDVILLLVPITAFFSVMFLIIGINSANQRKVLIRQRLERYSSEADIGGMGSIGSTILRDQRLSSFASLDQLLKRFGFAEGMALDLARAALPLRVGEYLLIRLLIALVLALIPLMVKLPLIVVLVFAVVGFYLPKVYVKRRQRSRVTKLNDQLVDLTSMVANALKSGNSFVQGLEMVSREMPPPVSEEVSQVLAEMNVGSSAEEALTNLTKRVDSYDLDLIVTAMLIQRQVGGNLAEILDKISSTIRERIRMLREIHALTAEARLSGYIVGLLPFFLIAILSIVSRHYLLDLLTNRTGQMMLGVAMVMELMGFIMLRKITDIEL